MKVKRKLFISLLTLMFIFCCAMTLVACKEESEGNNSYTVSFKVDGRNYDVVLAEEDNTVSMPSSPEKSGYSFDGWYLNEDFSGEKVTEIVKGTTGNLNLYAKFTANVYTISYNVNGGTNPNTTTSFTVEDKVVLADARKSGYLFKGWKNGDGEYMTAIPKGTTKNIALTAVFEKDGYTISYENINGAYHSNQKVYAADDETFAINAANKDGYTFNGWYLKEDFSGEKVTEIVKGTTGNITLYAKFTVNVYTITYNADGGTNPNTTTSFTVEDKVILADAEKSGYLFKGWKNGDDEYMTAIPKGTTKNIALTAVFEKEGYTISYENINGADCDNRKVYSADDETFAINAANKDGYTFNGWYLKEDFSGEKVTEIVKGTTGNITLYAKFTVNVYTITYNANGGTNPNTTTSFTVEDKVILADAEKSGYLFKGWKNGDDEYMTAIPKGTTKNIALTAVFEKEGYTISYENINGADCDNRKVYTADDETFAINAARKDGYTFDGWYLKEDFSGEKVTEIVKGTTGNITLYAKFTVNVYTITYNANGGTNPNTTTSFTVEDKVVLADAEKSGYLFKGWKNGDDEYMTAIPKGTTKNIALTAVFEKEGYTISYENINGADCDNRKVYSADDETFAINAANKDGYTFDGWYLNEDFSGETVTEIVKGTTGNLTLYAKFTVNVYTISYNADGATNPNTTTSFTVEDKVVLADAEKSGYLFKGWKNDDDEYMTAIPKGTTKNIALTAVFEKEGYTISYENINGADCDNRKVYTADDETFAINAANKDGYTFNGWYLKEDFSGEKVTEIVKGTTGNITLYAKFTVNVYTITYNANGATNPNTTTSFTVEDKVVLADAEKSGYLFKGWKNGDDEYMTAIPKGTTKNIVLTAVFEKEGYTITYENVEGAYYYNQKAYAVDDETFSIDPPYKEGYDFSGWYLNEDFSGEEVTEIVKGTTGNLTLYAKFDLLVYTITYENEKGAENRNENYFTTYSVENPVYSFFDLEKQGYVFEGWYHDITPVTRLMGNEWYGNVTLTAKWTPITYFISYENEKGQTNGNQTSFTVESGTLVFSDLPDTIDYEFKGWSFMNGNVPTTSLNASVLSDDISLTAMWKQKSEYKGLDYYIAPDESSVVVMGVTDTSITEIVIPDTTVMILNGAFKDCTSLTSLTIPFFGFERGATENTTIHYYFGDIVPSTLKEVTVKETNVPREAFKDCTSIKTVNLVGNIGTIGESAFENCSGIFYVNFNDVTLTSIGESAFENCGNLLTLRLPEGLTEIGEAAFYKCGTLYSVTMPTSITSMSQIGYCAFWDCNSLYEIYNLANLELTIGEYSDTDLGYSAKDVYTSADAVSRFGTDAKGNIFYDDATDGLTLIRYISTETTYAIPENVTTIQKAAFKGRNDMVEITLNSGLKKIGDEAFMNATGFDSLSITQEGLVVGKGAFENCSTITSVEILADGVNLGSYSFSGCSNLASLNIDADNLNISDAFRSLTLPQTFRIKTSGSRFSLTFSGCSGIKDFILDGNNNTIYYTFPRASVETVTINGNNAIIEQMAFQECRSLKTFTVNGGNCHLGAAIFRDCANLETITVTGGITSEIGGSAFNGCSSLKEFNYFGSLQAIGQIAFKNCTSLKNVEFGASLTSVGREAFMGCTSLETVVFDESSTPSIEEKAFMGCSLIESVILPSGATKIGTSAFMNCSRLYHVELPDNPEVQSDMFNGCKISVIALPAAITKYVGRTIFNNCNGDNLTTVFYFGTPEQLDRAHYIGFKYGSSLYYYNESPSLNKTNTAYEGDYWHYDSNHEPVLWNENTVSFYAYEGSSLQLTDHKIDKLMDGDYTTTFIAERLFEIDVTVTPSAPVSLKQFILTNGAKVSRMPREIFLIATDAATGETVTLYNTNPPTYSQEAYGTNVFDVDSGSRKFRSFTFRFITKNFTESSTEEITIEIGELEMVINPNDWSDYYSVIDGTAGNKNEGYANLTDASTGSKWCLDFESEAYLIIRAAEARVLNGYTFTTGSDNAECPGRNPKSWTIYGGDTFDYYDNNWKEITSVSDGQMTDENNKEFTFTVDGNTTAYKYYKIVFTANGGDGSLQLSELSLNFN